MKMSVLRISLAISTSVSSWSLADSQEGSIIYELYDQQPVYEKRALSPKQPNVFALPSNSNPNDALREILFLSASIDKTQGALLWWQHKGKHYRAYSNIDFNDLIGKGGFKIGESEHYSLIMSVGNATSVAPSTSFPEAIANSYPAVGDAVLYETENTVPVEALLAVDALHEYYAQNYTALKEARAARESTPPTERVQDPPNEDHVLKIWATPPKGAQQ